jgi:hypothetical protein
MKQQFIDALQTHLHTVDFVPLAQMSNPPSGGQTPFGKAVRIVPDSVEFFEFFKSFMF